MDALLNRQFYFKHLQDVSTFTDPSITTVVSSQLPPAIRPYLSAFASSSTDESDNPIINFAKQHLPLVMSLVALYFGVMSMMRTARMAWRFVFF